ncbi:MAG: hypothetical protein D6725_07515 [Planctomycetota bacterium]|nr:MAG: hypothetical protein D6725_07515 [Planctomycetota bacterium]
MSVSDGGMPVSENLRKGNRHWDGIGVEWLRSAGVIVIDQGIGRTRRRGIGRSVSVCEEGIS